MKESTLNENRQREVKYFGAKPKQKDANQRQTKVYVLCDMHEAKIDIVYSKWVQLKVLCFKSVTRLFFTFIFMFDDVTSFEYIF